MGGGGTDIDGEKRRTACINYQPTLGRKLTSASGESVMGLVHFHWPKLTGSVSKLTGEVCACFKDLF